MIQKEMEAMQDLGGNRNWERWKQLKCHLNKAYKEEEEFWSRKARVQWLKEGDKNTKYFHVVTAERRKKNRVDLLLDDMGKECKSEQEISEEIAKYFDTLFTTSSPKDYAEISEWVPRTITETMNAHLTRAVEDQEIKHALFSMHPYKAPRPDGMPPFFFQKYWNVVGSDICIAVKSFFQCKHMLTSFNHTLISLIPKIKKPTKVLDFRPISLCNVVYKII